MRIGLFFGLLLALAGCSSTENCDPQASTYCESGITYWLDSCENRQEVFQHCLEGCNQDNTGCAEGCNPQCAGRCCGNDGCGGVCPNICAEGQTCNASCVCEGTADCVTDTDCADGEVCNDGVCCTPQCTGLCCGDDGCGGSCPDNCAASGQTCNASCQCEGVCVRPTCQSLAAECGSHEDPCGGVPIECGECSYGTCTPYGVCVCSPECEGKCCGLDGCGGTCPDLCSISGQVCNAECVCEGVCERPTCEELGAQCGSHQDPCGGAPIECGGCGAQEQCNAQGHCECMFVDCLGVCCQQGQTCHNGSCCSAQSCQDLGLECDGGWDDGCGGTLECGDCQADEVCHDGTCGPPCEQDCWGRECGADPVCGLSCGDCDPADVCQEGRCVRADCDNLPPLPVGFTTMNGMTTCEDFTFDTEGRLVGVSFHGCDLIRMSYSGDVELLIPNVGCSGGGQMAWVRGNRFLPDGDFVVADPTINSLLRVDLAGDVQPILGGMPDPNGIAIGRDGFAYVAHTGGDIYRVNPDNGDFSVLYSSYERYDGITFSPDYRTLYFNEENQGEVHQMTINEDGTAGPESTLATIDGGGFMNMFDGMAADECGNVYVVQMNGNIHRVTPDGDVDLVASVGKARQPGGIMAINFGTGVGGWQEDRLYAMGQDNKMYEINVGVRGKWEPHLP